MDFKTNLNVRVGMDQRLVMTAQLQQAIKLLQLSRAELVESIAEALETNPVLEEVPASDAPGEIQSAMTSGDGQVTDLESPPEPPQRTEVDWQDYFTDLARAPTEGVGAYRDTEDERHSLAQTLTRASTLGESLIEQLASARLDACQMAIVDEIIGNLDDDGYLRPTRLDVAGGPRTARDALRAEALAAGLDVQDRADGFSLYWLTDPQLEAWMRKGDLAGCDTECFVANSLQGIADAVGCSLPEVLQVLALVQGLEPLGVASADVRQCLAVQARVLHPDDTALQRLIDVHLPNIEAREYGAIRRDLRVSPDELEALLRVLATLEPRPGRRFTGETARYITPDVFVVKLGDDYAVVLNEDGLPKLRIAGYYQHVLENGKGERPTAQGEQAKEFLHERLRAAQWMIRSIHQRQSTIQRVTEAIMESQRPFLDFGVDKLRPLVLRDVAEKVKLHESTVSRVTTNKFVHTPQGIFELKYFFGARISAQGTGDDMAAEAVRQAVKKLIDKEIVAAPLSDQEIAEILQGEWDRGRMLARLTASENQVDSLKPVAPMTIARRTVAKYREQMGIESSSRRRRTY
ncbi:MAG: RNA polymerase sigma-54 factor [Deltaproteobacteria bacterium]|nr:RNA polymerase sigma-54 factor [Deltaproteobacteria bacterium]